MRGVVSGLPDVETIAMMIGLQSKHHGYLLSHLHLTFFVFIVVVESLSSV